MNGTFGEGGLSGASWDCGIEYSLRATGYKEAAWGQVPGFN
jgi:hypothetical protein